MAKKLKKKERIMELIIKLKAKGNKTKQKFWKDIAERLERPRRIIAAVNVEKIEKLREKYGDKLFIVPGKLLGKGSSSKAVRVAALGFTTKAKAEIESNKGEAHTLKELVEMDVNSKDVFIVQ